MNISQITRIKSCIGDKTTSNNFVVKIPENIELSPSENSVLEKGLSFIPQSKSVDVFQTFEDTQRLFRKVRLKAHFSNLNDDTQIDDEPNVDVMKNYNKKPSTFTPKPGEFEAVDNFIATCQKQAN